MPIIKRKPTRLSEEVIRRQRPAVDIEKSASSNAGAVAVALETFLAQGLPEGQTVPDMTLIQVILGNIVRKHSDEMEAADERHFEALSRLNHLQLVRDNFRGRLIPTLTDIRDAFDTAFGVDTCQRILGIGVNIPTENLRVRRVGDRVLSRLTAPDFELPPAISEVVGVDPAKWIAQLTPDLNGLRDSMDRLSDAKRESERTLAAKTLAVEVYHESYLRGSQLLETFYRVSGHGHLAEKLRPPTPKPKSPEDAAKAAAKGDGAEENEEATEADDAEQGEAREADAAADQAPTAAPQASSRLILPAEAGAATSEARPDRPPADARSAES